jgi:hypothetical protein
MRNRTLRHLPWLFNGSNQEGSTTMRTELQVAAIAVFAAALFVAGSAQAAFIAGWDFSQYAGGGGLQVSEDIDENPINSDTLKSNYSDYDPTFGAGGDSQDYGTMYINGMNGSTDVDENALVPVFRATSGSLGQNLTTPGANEVPSGDVNFGATSTVLQTGPGNYLAGTGQDYTISLSMIASATVNVVFEANLTALGALNEGQNWTLAFSGRTNTGDSNVSIEFSTDGSTWTAPTIVNLSATDALFTHLVPGNQSDKAFFRLGFAGSASLNPRIDNVTISGDVSLIPEPGTAMLMLLGLTGLGVAGRRHRS